jgi:XTP/dITP diphosphohydrolase
MMGETAVAPGKENWNVLTANHMNRILVIGTGNKHKVGEVAPLLSGLPIILRAAGEYGPFHPDESGGTAEENAIIKARAALALSGEWAIADDTGLDIRALGGRPGIHAARYAGPRCDFDDNIRKVLGEMEDVPDEQRTATFFCVIALCRPGHAPLTFRGECKGRICRRRQGSGGFGYDPIFLMDEMDKTFAELSAEEKNRLSHRARAVTACRRTLETLL